MYAYVYYDIFRNNLVPIIDVDFTIKNNDQSVFRIKST